MNTIKILVVIQTLAKDHQTKLVKKLGNLISARWKDQVIVKKKKKKKKKKRKKRKKKKEKKERPVDKDETINCISRECSKLAQKYKNIHV